MQQLVRASLCALLSCLLICSASKVHPKNHDQAHHKGPHISLIGLSLDRWGSKVNDSGTDLGTIASNPIHQRPIKLIHLGIVVGVLLALVVMHQARYKKASGSDRKDSQSTEGSCQNAKLVKYSVGPTEVFRPAHQTPRRDSATFNPTYFPNEMLDCVDAPVPCLDFDPDLKEEVQVYNDMKCAWESCWILPNSETPRPNELNAPVMENIVQSFSQYSKTHSINSRLDWDVAFNSQDWCTFGCHVGTRAFQVCLFEVTGQRLLYFTVGQYLSQVNGFDAAVRGSAATKSTYKGFGSIHAEGDGTCLARCDDFSFSPLVTPLTHPSSQLWKDDPNSRLWRIRDVANQYICKRQRIMVIEGDLSGHTGTIHKSGGKVNVQEGERGKTVESLRSVHLDYDPSHYTARVFDQSHLESYDSEPRRELRRVLNKCLNGMEKTPLPEPCNQLLLPLLREATDAVENGSAETCSAISDILSARLRQVLEEVLKQRQSK